MWPIGSALFSGPEHLGDSNVEALIQKHLRLSIQIYCFTNTMNYRTPFVVLVALALPAVACARLSRSSVLGDGIKTFNYWLTPTFTSFSYSWPPTCGWELGTFMAGVAALHEATDDKGLLDWQFKFSDHCNWQLFVDGPGASFNPDNQLCAATYADLYLKAKPEGNNSTWIAGAIAQLDVEIASDSSWEHWAWVDTLYMAMSVYARIGAATGDVKYFDKMLDNFNRSSLVPHPDGFGFWSPADGLFYRDPVTSTPSGVFWSRGNGWATGALVAAISHSPADHPGLPIYLDIFKQHVARLKELQGADGCWRVSLTDPAFNPVPETTGTAMFVHGIAYGIHAGILDSGTYMPVVESGWSCLSSIALQPSGLVGYCQPGGASPQRNVARNTTNDFCVGMFMLAAASVSKLAA